MKKLIFVVSLILLASTVWAKSPFLFNKFSLDDSKASVEKILKSEFKGKYTIDEYGGFELKLTETKTVYLGFDDNGLSYITVFLDNCTYSDFLTLVGKIIQKHGDPKGSYVDGDNNLVLYWWPQDPGFDLRVTISLEPPYSLSEAVLYGK